MYNRIARTSAKLVKPRQRPAHLLQHGRRDPLGTFSLIHILVLVDIDAELFYDMLTPVST
jgi:hypothetical protein